MSNNSLFDRQFTGQPRETQPQTSSSGKLLLTLAIVGGGVILLFIVGAALGVWLVLSRQGYAAQELWEEHLAYVIETSVLPPGERTAVQQQVKRLARACSPMKMSQAQLEEVLSELEASPVFVLLDVGGIEQEIVGASGLSSAVQERARRTVRRAARGVHAGKIDSDDFYDALPPGYFFPTQLTVALRDEDLEEYNSQFSEPTQPASDDDIKAALVRLTALADSAGIAFEPWTFDVSDEFTTAVDRALAVVEP